MWKNPMFPFYEVFIKTSIPPYPGVLHKRKRKRDKMIIVSTGNAKEVNHRGEEIKSTKVDT